MTQPDRETPQPIRVALVTDNYGPTRSGILFAVQFLEGELLAAGHRITVVAPRANGPNPYVAHPRRSEIRLPSVRIPGVGARVATGQQFESRLEQLSRERFDVIHVHGLGPVGLLGVWLAKRAGIPLLVTWHTDFEAYADHYSHLAPFLDGFYRLLKLRNTSLQMPTRKDFARMLRQRPRSAKTNLLTVAKQMLEDADLVTTPSDKTAKRVLELAPLARVVAVPNGADALPSGPPLRKHKGPRILFVGRVAPEKGIGLLLDAFLLVEDEMPDAELMIVGDWRKSPVLRERLRLASHRHNVTLVGEVDRDKLQPYYESADVFCFPSLTDTQALVLHEAAHAGLPIVSVDPELQMVCESPGNARFARPSPVSLSDELLAMLRDCADPDTRAAMSARSRELAAQYTIAKQSALVMDLYAQLAALDKRPPQPRARGSRFRSWRTRARYLL